MIEKRVFEKLKNAYLLDMLKCDDIRATSATVALARFLNEEPLQYNFFPLYLKVFETNNKYAIDALLADYIPERFLEVVIVPNNYVIENIFRLFTTFKREGMYQNVIRVFCGFLFKVYATVDEGIRFYLPTISDINNLGKHLNESKDQKYPLNRVILDILSSIMDLDAFAYKNDQVKLDIARQASRIRSDYFDARRKLNQSITDVILERAETTDFGIAPDAIYLAE